MSQNAPRTHPKAPKLSPTWSSWRYHGPSILGATCCQLGPSWAHLGPIFGPTLLKISTKSRQRPQEAPPDTPRPPRGSPKSSRIALGLDFYGFGIDFGAHILKKFSLSPLILHGLPASSSARWRLCARSALDNPPPPAGVSGVCRPRCPACPISNFQPYLMVPGRPPRALKCPRQPASLAYLVPFFDISWPS